MRAGTYLTRDMAAIDRRKAPPPRPVKVKPAPKPAAAPDKA